MQASVRVDHALVAVEGEHHVHLMLELVVPSTPTARAPLALALVLDRSGSMAGRKLETARRCASWLVRRLAPEDRLALVDFDDHVRLLAPLGPPERARLEPAIAMIREGGSTNLSGGWLKGVEALRDVPGPARKVLLLTDGLANQGVTDRETLAQLAHSASSAGVGTATIGLGEDFDEELLTAMADAGGGNAHYAPSADAAPGIFARELAGLAHLAAQNLSVELRPADPVRVVGVLNDYPAVPVPGGIQLQLGDVIAGERLRVVAELEIPHLAGLGPARVCDLVVRYVGLGDDVAHHELTLPVVVNAVSAAEAAGAVPDAEVREQVMVLRAARARDEAVRRADEGDWEGARASLGSVAVELRACAPQGPAGGALRAEADALDREADDVAADRWSSASRKRLHYRSHSSKRGRSE